IRHPFWPTYYGLLPRLAAEHFAMRGERDLARSVLAVLQDPDVSDFEQLQDIVHANRYREAVAWAALGEYQRAIEIAEAIPNGAYLAVGYHRISVHAAAAGQFDLAFRLVDAIDDANELEHALAGMVPALIAAPDPIHARALADRLMARGQQSEALIALTAGGW